ncbi:hypothetical protein [Streptomyces sp. NPDC060065]|uniref:hypothetical protein n=1 Tax=Streptomyces sp. NPDC060065 TaxID=3347050 RepID=UPI00369FC405
MPAASGAPSREPSAEDRTAAPFSQLIAQPSDSRTAAPVQASEGRAGVQRPGSTAAEETAPRGTRTAAATAPPPAAVLPVRADGSEGFPRTTAVRHTDQLPTGREQRFPDGREAGSPALGPRPAGPTPPMAPTVVRTATQRPVGAADPTRLAPERDTPAEAPAPPTATAQVVVRAVHPTVTVVPATVAPGPGLRREPPAPEPQEPVINVTIDHVEVRPPAPAPPAAPPVPRRPGPPVMTMDDYLNRRRGHGGQ